MSMGNIRAKDAGYCDAVADTAAKYEKALNDALNIIRNRAEVTDDRHRFALREAYGEIIAAVRTINPDFRKGQDNGQ